MRTNNLYRLTSIFLITIAILSYFFGFYMNENSAGAGSYEGDFKQIWNNIQIFLANDLVTSIQHPSYDDSRAPTAYIFHEIFNPFIKSEISFRRCVFVISTSLPILLYFCLRKKFKNEEGLILMLISSTLFLSPYFRTTAYWGLEENYGLIFLLLTYLAADFLDKENNEFQFKEYVKLIIVILLSSLCFYFDQKLIIIPIICFFKIFSIFCYFLFSLPYIYFIMLWGTLIPTSASVARNVGNKLFLDHLGFALTIIAFYLLPILLFKGEKLITLIRNLFSNKKNYFLSIFFIFYLIYLISSYGLSQDYFQGKGIIFKASLILFEDHYYGSIFIYISFLISWLIVLIYFDKVLKDFYILGYFLILSVILHPIYQEYFDPLILILAFTFFSTKIYVNYKNSIILYLYLSILLISANVYYYNLLN